MFATLFIIANICASLVLFFTQLGAIQIRKINVDIATVLSIAVSYVFIGICVVMSILHPMLFVFYSISVAGMLIMFLRPQREELGLAILTTITGFLFWPEMIALMIFNSLFLPKEDDENGH